MKTIERTSFAVRNLPARLGRGWKAELARLLRLPIIDTELTAVKLDATRLAELAWEQGRTDVLDLLAAQMKARSAKSRNSIAAELHRIVRKSPELCDALTDFGVLGRRSVTTAGAAYLVDSLQNLTEPENLNYHDSGTGSTAENVADTTLETKVETGRTTGTQSEPSSTSYKSTGTIAYTAGRTLREHGLFSASSAGTLLDRTVFAAVGVSNGDSVQYGYTFTINTGG